MSKKTVEELMIAGGYDEKIRRKYDVLKTMDEFVALADTDGYQFNVADLEDVLRESGDSFESIGNPTKKLKILRNHIHIFTVCNCTVAIFTSLTVGNSSKNAPSKQLRGKPFNVPFVRTVASGVTKPVVQSVFPPLPELYLSRFHTVSTPKRGYRHLSLTNLGLHLLEFLCQDLAGGQGMTLTRNPGRHLRFFWSAHKIFCRLRCGYFRSCAVYHHLPFKIQPDKKQTDIRVFTYFNCFPAFKVGEKDKTFFVEVLQQNSTLTGTSISIYC